MYSFLIMEPPNITGPTKPAACDTESRRRNRLPDRVAEHQAWIHIESTLMCMTASIYDNYSGEPHVRNGGHLQSTLLL